MRRQSFHITHFSKIGVKYEIFLLLLNNSGKEFFQNLGLYQEESKLVSFYKEKAKSRFVSSWKRAERTSWVLWSKNSFLNNFRGNKNNSKFPLTSIHVLQQTFIGTVGLPVTFWTRFIKNRGLNLDKYTYIGHEKNNICFCYPSTCKKNIQSGL